MKKAITLITSLLILIVSTVNLNAQEKAETSNCVGKGKIIIDPYYGYPYLFGKYIQTVIAESGENIGVTNTNHLGIKAEYMVTKMIGIGVDYTYAKVIGSYSETNSVYNPSLGIYVDQTEKYTASITKQRILAKINIHFATSKYLDPYAVGGIGYKNSVVRSDNVNDQDDVNDLNSSILNAFPISFRLGIGLRYYFIKNLGVAVEAGIGGPIIQGGLSLKF
ncbi:MAG: outer membrane beta-barrel protein [Bacteroidetes bacterium]|nr:outer membrane beta-barrel protein [Bacteroidota bacterium]